MNPQPNTPSTVEDTLGRAAASPVLTGKRRSRDGFPVPVPEIPTLSDPRLIGARCAGMAPTFDAWLPTETDVERSERLTYAAQLCNRCPVQAPCRAAADEHSASGMWGGLLYGDTTRPRAGVA